MDQHWAWESQIDEWEPGKRLRLVENRPAFDVNGEPLAGPSQQLAMEFTLETHAGQTRLRIVHSGSGEGAGWDDELDSVSAGRQFELRGLRHYLEHHKGRDRQHAATHHVTSLATDDVWKASSARRRSSSPKASLTRAIASASAPRRATNLRVPRRGTTRTRFFVTVDDLNNGVLRLSIWRAGGQDRRAGADYDATTRAMLHVCASSAPARSN